jgi:putative SOS response-associated peptidase YedK
MSGHAYSTYTDDEISFDYLNRRPLKFGALNDGLRDFDYTQRELIPEWPPKFSTMLSTINAKSESANKRPFKIYLKGSSIISFAGMWTASRGESLEEQRSFSIRTTAANDFMANIPGRTPVILDAKDRDQWLDPEPADISTLLKTYTTDLLDCCENPPLVNSPGNNRAEVLELLQVGLESEES